MYDLPRPSRNQCDYAPGNESTSHQNGKFVKSSTQKYLWRGYVSSQKDQQSISGGQNNLFWPTVCSWVSLIFVALKSVFVGPFCRVRFQASLWPEVSWLPTAPSKKMATTNLGIAGSWVNRWNFFVRKNRSETNKNHQTPNQNSAPPTPPKKNTHFPSNIFLFLVFWLVAFKDWIKLSSPEIVWVKIYDRDSLGLDSFEKKQTNNNSMGGPGVCVFVFFFRWEVKVKNTYTVYY